MRAIAVLWCALLFLSAQNSSATHLRAVEITVAPVSCGSYMYEITVTAYVKAGAVLFGSEGTFLYFGDGEKQNIPPTNSVEVDPFNQVHKAVFKTTHTFPAPGQYLVHVMEPNRNEGILNMSNSVSTPLYTESLVIIHADHCNSLPEFQVPPVDRGCSRVAFYHNPGGYDRDGDSLSFELAIPKKDDGTPVENYALPSDQKFYTAVGINFAAANENMDGPPTLAVDPVTGLITWDAPGVAGEYAIAIKMIEWKFNVSDSTWYQHGYVVRDMQIIVENCNNSRPTLSTETEICVMAGEEVDFTVRGHDGDGDLVLIESFSELYSLNISPAERTPSSDVLQATHAPNDTASMKFHWRTTCDHIRDQFYSVVFKISDRPGSGPRLVQFKTVRIHVMAPAPEYEKVTVNPISKSISLQWKAIPCENTVAYQVWRRVSEYEYTQPECETGMARHLRYKLIAEVAPDDNSYVDTDLAIGALYCYRIVPLVGEGKTPGKISQDTCLIPKPAEAPIITNVSVAKTASTTGEIMIRWTTPFDIDKVQYPPPYTYRVFRSQDGSEFAPVSGILSDTAFLDQNVNTLDYRFEYWIQLYVPALSTNPVDSSSIASSVYSTVVPASSSINVAWDSETPWYNFLKKHPYHLIYRSTDADEGFILIDSVNVNENGFVYQDNGTYANQPLQEGTMYYYKVLTRGGYGNPKISEPLENFSQIASALIDNSPPCAPVISLEKQDCAKLPCSETTYHNTLHWTPPSAECAESSLSYLVLMAEDENAQFSLLTSTTETHFVHTPLVSQTKCYKIIAVDLAGNQSEPSNEVCGDNCAYFSMPNVFTPGNSDGKNDYFMPGGDKTESDGCAKFVEKVDLRIFNRWGQEIFLANDIGSDGKFLLWDGSLQNGDVASAGVYFYEAQVVFNVRDASAREKTIKGWVHVVKGDH